MSHEVGDCWLQSAKVARRLTNIAISYWRIVNSDDSLVNMILLDTMKLSRHAQQLLCLVIPKNIHFHGLPLPVIVNSHINIQV